jgi:NAD(P)-dependent dehydrogenase (short-subunit alcohol dehydrogenase family)
MKAALQRGERVHPRELGKQVKHILAGREIRGTLDALGKVGSDARYDAVDVTNLDGLRQLYADVQESWGPVTGIIHGAGVIRDRFIREKTDEDFNLVVRTKLDGLRSLLGAQGEQPLKLLLTFSSVAARTGNVGQVDYAMANEVLNRVCDAMARQHPEAVIRSLGWGPWEAGMVTPALKARFESLGVPLIGLDTGAKMLVDEVRNGPGMPTSVVLGGEPRPEALLHDGNPPPMELDIHLSAKSHPWLVDHTVAGVPVVPVALVVDQMLSAAHGLFPGHPSGQMSDLNVHKGIRLDQWPASTHLRMSVQDNGDHTLGMMLTTPSGQPLYRATVSLNATAGPTSGIPQLDLPSRDGAVYDGTLLFHGPALQVLDDDVCVDASGATAGLSSRPLTGTAAVNVGAVDGALQLALLWAEAATGGASLPMGIDELSLHQPNLDDTAGLVLTRRTASGPTGSADIVLVNAKGEATATLRGVRTIRRPDVPRA